ncbi:unnamed protein product [Urochloa decumbens]|uniref:F-box domain-containing protein n=1 Tax=Urochloa decumbens TaxID=240449 RepID=A0ABC9DAB1_9POAL
MAQSGGEIAAKRAKLSGAGACADADCLSALPDDVLVLILLRLDTAAAGRTSVLSRRWRLLWALVPELRFPRAPPPDLVVAALSAHQAALRHLLVGVDDAGPESVGAWLRFAARRLSGGLILRNRVPEGDCSEEEELGRGALELPCLENATTAGLDLGFLGLAVPPAGVFAQLTELSLACVRFHGPCELGDAISSPRCPCLQKLSIRNSRGLPSLTIHSASLLEIHLRRLYGLQKLTVVAPALGELKLIACFAQRRPVANISAPQLWWLVWNDSYDPSSVELGDLGKLRRLTTNSFYVYGPHGCIANQVFQWLLERFQVIHDLIIQLDYPTHIGSFQYLMEDFTMLPRVNSLALYVHNQGHAFGAGLFHVLRICSDLEEMALGLHPRNDLEVHSQCESGCVCDQPSNWKTDELTLNHLQEVVIIDMTGTDQ